jgi:ubiquinone/menaquinone biosynthesis C-methylase UbiE
MDGPPDAGFWAAMFDAVADDYDQSGVPFFATIAEGLVERLAPARGEHVLDVGSGRGAATLRLAERVGPSGRVHAVDVSSRMVELLREVTAQRGLTQVTVTHGDAAVPPEGRYDVVCASLLLFFLPEPVAGLAAWRARLAPGGRIGISSFAPWPEGLEAVTDVLDSYRPADVPSSAQMPPAFATDETVEDLFRSAGLSDVRTERATYDIPFTDVQQWRAWSMGTALRGLWVHVPPDEVEEALERVDEVLVAAGHRLPVDIRYTLADA